MPIISRAMTAAWMLGLGLLPVLAQAPAPPAPPGPPAPQIVTSDTPLGSGPHRAIMEMDDSLPGHTIYRPSDLAAAGKLPLLVWGNGACANSGIAHRWFLADIASYGYLAIANGPIPPLRPEQGRTSYAPIPPTPRPGSGPPRPSPALGAPATRTAQLNEAMDWAIAQNKDPRSKYYGKLDTSKIAVAGMSCGGVQAIEASADPRTTTTIVMNSGMPIGGTDMTGTRLDKDALKKLHGPVAYITGDEQDVAFYNAEDDFRMINHLPVFRGYERGMVHGGTYGDRNGGEFAPVAVAWLNWQLKGDARSALMFKGENCGLCVNPRWVVGQKSLR